MGPRLRASSPTAYEHGVSQVASDRTLYTLKSASALAVLRVCGWIDVVGGLTLAALEISLVFLALTQRPTITSEDWQGGVIVAVAAPVAIYAGWSMLIYGVRLTPFALTSGGAVLRKCSRADIIALNARRQDFHRLERTVPFVVLRDGTSFPLISLASKVGSNGAGLGLGRVSTQPEVVAQLRHDLGVGGSDVPI